ncbi:hypothetical protein [Bacillus inaquosorum]
MDQRIGTHFEGEITYTRVWQNKNGKWRIVSGHSSSAA